VQASSGHYLLKMRLILASLSASAATLYSSSGNCSNAPVPNNAKSSLVKA